MKKYGAEVNVQGLPILGFSLVGPHNNNVLLCCS